MKQTVTFSLQQACKFVDALIEKLEELLTLELEALIEFKNSHQMRRQPVRLEESLPEITALPQHRIPTSRAVMVQMVNHHLANNDMCLQVDDAAKITIYFREGTEKQIITALADLRADLKATIFPNILRWTCRTISADELRVSCQSPPYTLSLLGFCLQQPLLRVQQTYVLQNDSILKDFSTENDLLVNNLNSLQLCAWMSDLDIQLDYENGFFEDVTTYCHSFSPEAGSKFQLVLGMFLKLSAQKNRVQLSELYAKLGKSYDLPHLQTLITMHDFISQLNRHIAKGRRYVSSETGESLSLLNAPKTAAFYINLMSLEPLKNEILLLDKYCFSGMILHLEHIFEMLVAISALNVFFSDPLIPHEAKAELATLCYLRYLQQLSHIAKTLLPQIDVKHPQAEPGFMSVFQLAKHTYKHITHHKEDCFHLLLACGIEMLDFYFKLGNTDKVEQHLGWIQARAKRADHDVDHKLLKLHLDFSQLRLEIARGSLTAALLTYQALEDSLEAFLKTLKPADLILAIFLILNRVQEAGDLVAQALSHKGCFRLGIEVCEQALQHYRKMNQMLDQLIKPPLVIPHTEKHAISRLREIAMNSHEGTLKNLTKAHLEDLQQSLSTLKWLSAECVVVSGALAIRVVDRVDLPYLKTAFHAAKLKFKESKGALFLSDLRQVQKSDLRSACNRVAVLKYKAAHQAENLPVQEIEVQQEPAAVPRYPYFIELFHTRSQAKPRRVPKTPVAAVVEAPKPLVKPLCLKVDFGNGRIYDEAGTGGACSIIALQDDYRPHGIFFGRLSPDLPQHILERYQQALANIDATHGFIVGPEGQEGAKFFKKQKVKCWKVKIPGHDDFIVGHMEKEIEDVDQHGLPIKRFLICFDDVQNHKKEQRLTKK